jgi:hypothetical protein
MVGNQLLPITTPVRRINIQKDSNQAWKTYLAKVTISPRKLAKTQHSPPFHPKTTP